MTVTEFGAAQAIDQDPVSAALRAAASAIIALRTVNYRAARHLSLAYDQIAQQHTSGILADADTIHSLARHASDAGAARAT